YGAAPRFTSSRLSPSDASGDNSVPPRVSATPFKKSRRASWLNFDTALGAPGPRSACARIRARVRQDAADRGVRHDHVGRVLQREVVLVTEVAAFVGRPGRVSCGERAPHSLARA